MTGPFPESSPVDVVLEAAFDAAPDDDLSLAVWTDIKDRLVGATYWGVGRHGLGGQSDAATISCSLNNDDGWLTSRMRKLLPVRLSVGLTGDTPGEELVCWVKSARFSWDTTGDTCRVAVSARGRLDRLDRPTAATQSAAAGSATASGAVASWPLTDGESATSAASALAGGTPMTKSGSIHFGTGEGGIGQPNILDLAYHTGSVGKLVGTVPAGTSATSWRVEFQLRWPDSGAAYGIVGLSTAGTIKGWTVGHDGTDLRLEYTTEAGMTRLTAVTADFADGELHTYRLTADQDGADVDVTLSIDGDNEIVDTISSQTLGRVTKATINPDGNNGSQMPAIGYLNVWAPYVASPGTDTVAAAAGYVGESAGDRIQRLCEQNNIPVVVMPGATSAMGVQESKSVIALLRECEAADGGLLHDGGPDGALVYQPRQARYNAPVVMTLDVTTRHELADGFGGVIDDRDLVTDLTVNLPDGTSGRYALDDTAGVPPEEIALNLDGESENPTQHAAWLVGLADTDELSHDSIPLDLADQPDVVALWQASDRIGIRVTVTGLPSQHPAEAIDQFVDGYTASSDGFTWLLGLDAVPAAPYEVIVLDTSAATLSATVDADDTTWTSVVSEPPRWTTTDVPLGLVVEDEEVTATAIADVAITYVSGNTVTHANNGGSLSPALPGSMQAGDLILLFAAIRDTAATVDVPSGYTRLAGWHNMALLGKIHTGSESAPTVTFTGGGANDTTSCAMFAVRGTISDADHVVIGRMDWSNPASSASVAYPPLAAPKYDGCIVFYFIQQAGAWSSLALLSGFSEVLDSASGLGDDQSVAAGYQIQTTATAIPSSTLTITGGASGVSRSMLVAIGPGYNTLTVTRAAVGAATHAAGEQIQVAATAHLGL